MPGVLYARSYLGTVMYGQVLLSKEVNTMLTDEQCLQFCYYYIRKYKGCEEPEIEAEAVYELLEKLLQASSDFQIVCLKAADNKTWGNDELNLCCLFE